MITTAGRDSEQPEDPKKKHKRSRDGCLTCRKHRKACDKEKPECARCRRLSYECTWPVFPNDKPTAIKKKNKAPAPLPRPVDSLPVSELAGGTNFFYPSYSLSAFEETQPELFSSLEPMLTQSQQIWWLSHNSEYDEPLFAAALESAAPVAPAPGDQLDIATLIQAYREEVTTPESPSADDLSTDLPEAFFAVAGQYFIGSDEAYTTYATYLLELQTHNAMCKTVGMALNWELALHTFQNTHRVTPTTLPNDPAKIAEFKQIVQSSYRFKKRAEALLDRAIQDGAPLTFTIHTLLSLAYWEFGQTGADHYYANLMRAHSLLKESLPPSPVINLCEIHSIRQYELLDWIMLDVYYSVVHLCPTKFCYIYAPDGGDVNRADSWRGFRPLNGVPDEVLVILGDISNLNILFSDENEYEEKGKLIQRVNQIEERIRNFQPIVFVPSKSSMTSIARVAMQEMWRHTAYIHYYQRLYNLTSTTTDVYAKQAAVCGAMIELMKFMQSQCPSILKGPVHFCIFMACTVAFTSENRQYLRQLWVDNVGAHRAFADDLAFLDAFWWESDLNGVPVDWHELLNNTKGIHRVAFL